MNYVGSVSIIDRGDAPAKAIIEKNTRSLAQRVADETKEELDKVMDRVDNIYVSYEMSTQTMFDNPRASPNVEYIEDIKELEEILNDTVKKKKYQQQVTVFVVGFQDVCTQKMQLLSQVNQFFLENSKMDEEELTEEKPEVDLEDAANQVHESLNTAGELAKKLSDLNQDIIEWLVNYANTKASNKGKKRLEKNLESAKAELTDLSEKLLKLQTELEEKDEKFQQVAKQLEAKTQEATRYKTAAEVAKQLEQQGREKLAKLQEEVDNKKLAISDAEREMEKLHKDQLTSLHKEHQKEVEELKTEHKEELSKLTGKSIAELSANEEDGGKQESRPSTKDTKSSKKSESLKPTRSQVLKSPSRAGKDKQVLTNQDDDVGSKLAPDTTKDASRQPTRQSKNLETVIEGDASEFPNAFDLEDEESWSTVPAQQMPGRFLQFRQLSRAKMKDLEEQLNVTMTKTHRKVNSLKSQFNEHKNKWETERKVLIEQVEQAQKLQTDAEKEADAAMTQLEEFINEQEKLEDEEEAKRQELIKTMSRPGTVKRVTSPPADKPSTPDEKAEEQAQGERIHSENSEQELKNLLQQTDDAKAQEKTRHAGAISAPPAVEPEHRHKIEREAVTGNSEDEVRISSAKSRASLRNHFKSRLDETRHAAESRRTKSPVIQLPTQMSVDDELIIEDDEDDLPIPDDAKEEALHKDDTMDGEAARKISVASRKSINLAEHPVVAEYLRAYNGVHKFKEAMGNVLVDKDQMSASQLLTDLEALTFDKEGKVVPQISNMTENIYFVLNEVSQVLNNVLQNDRGPVVSSLMTSMSRDDTQRSMMLEKSKGGDNLPLTRQTIRSVSTRGGSASTDRQQFSELQANYERLRQQQNQMVEESRRYEDQHQRNMVAMMEMQDTINNLQRELSALGKQSKRPASETVSTTGGIQQTESAIMFTRLDSERNAKIMKKAVNEEKLDPNRYKEAVVQMDEYVSLPAKRLAHLVRKYVHHCRMKEIEDNVQQSQSLNQNVFEILDKMEALQSQRAKRWNDRMDEMGSERYRIAGLLTETLDMIEQESGIFLIKPMYSYRGREPKERFGAKISRPFRPHRTLSPLRDSSSAYAPAPTPASNVRPPRIQRRPDPDQYPSVPEGAQPRYEPSQPLEGNTTGLTGSSVNYQGTMPQATWSMSDSQIGPGQMYTTGNVNTPRILEIDINRMMIGQNTISANVGSQGLSNDRLVNASNNNLRSYMTVNRPGPGSAGKSERPRSGTRTSPILSSSPTNLSSSQKRVRMSAGEADVPNVMTTSQPLPPIGVNGSFEHPKSGSSKGKNTPHRVPVVTDLPESPPGSSLRQSPPAE